METFLRIILATGLIQLPKMEDYWKKHNFYYHPMFNKLNISYNRFALLLKNWHIADNQTAPTDDRLYKVANFVQKLISKFQAVYHPGEDVAVDETMIPHQGILLFRPNNRRENQQEWHKAVQIVQNDRIHLEFFYLLQQRYQ